jgi:hypothetical protein
VAAVVWDVAVASHKLVVVLLQRIVVVAALRLAPVAQKQPIKIY